MEQGFAAVAVVPKGQLAEEEEEEGSGRMDGWGGGDALESGVNFFQTQSAVS